MHEVRGTLCTQQPRRTRWTRSVEPDRYDFRKGNFRVSSGNPEPLFDLSQADVWPLLRKRGVQSGNVSNVSYKQVKPSGNFTQLQHNAFSISYPSNWQTASDQNSTVTIAPQAGVSQGAIAYGIIVGGAQNQSAPSLDQAMRALIQNLQQSNPGMQVSGNPKNIQVNGAQGRSVNLTSTSPVQENGRALAERDWLVALARPQGGLLYVVFIAPENQFRRLSRTYKKMLNSLRLK